MRDDIDHKFDDVIDELENAVQAIDEVLLYISDYVAEQRASQKLIRLIPKTLQRVWLHSVTFLHQNLK